jgi:hypothetical protein
MNGTGFAPRGVWLLLGFLKKSGGYRGEPPYTQGSGCAAYLIRYNSCAFLHPAEPHPLFALNSRA